MKQKKSFLCRHNRCLNTAKAICVSFLFSIPAGTAVAAVHAAEVDIVQQNETVKGTVLDEQGIPVLVRMSKLLVLLSVLLRILTVISRLMLLKVLRLKSLLSVMLLKW